MKERENTIRLICYNGTKLGFNWDDVRFRTGNECAAVFFFYGKKSNLGFE